MILNLYMYEFFKSRFIEENVDKLLAEEEIASIVKDKYPLLHIYDIESFINTFNKEYSFLKKIEKLGTKIKIKGWNYNLNTIASILSEVVGYVVNSKDLVVANPEYIDERRKRISVMDKTKCRLFKMTIDLNNKNIVTPKEYDVYGVNELLVSETSIDVDTNDFMFSTLVDMIKNNNGWISDRNNMYILNNFGLDKEFLRKWDRDNIMVYCDFTNPYAYSDYNFEECDFYDDEDGF